MNDDDLSVRGGVGGIAARIAQIEALAGDLDDAGAELHDLGRHTLGLLDDPDLLASGLWCPEGLAVVEALLTAAAIGPCGLEAGAQASSLGADAVRAAIAGLAACDEAVSLQLAAIDTALVGAGLLTLPLLLPGIEGAGLLDGPEIGRAHV